MFRAKINATREISFRASVIRMLSYVSNSSNLSSLIIMANVMCEAKINATREISFKASVTVREAMNQR